MKNKSLLIASTILAFTATAEGQHIKNTRPNVVIIIADDYRYDWMHHKGKDFMETPHLDRMAKEGWSFPNAFCCAGVCSPTRAALLTGKYIHQASAPDIVWQNNSFLQLQEMFPQKLHKQGYKTGYIGKFHLGEEEKPKPNFDLWASFPFVGNYFNQTIWINGRAKHFKGFTDDNVTELADSTIEKWSGDSKPFCLIVGLKSPHIPFSYPERMKAKYGDVVFKEPETFNLDYSESKPGLSKNLINAKTWPAAIPKYGSFQEWVRAYTRTAATIDESLGKIMDAIEKAGIADNTIIVFTSDQGYSLGEQSMCEKHYAYEQVMRVPLMVRFPNQKEPGNPPTDMVMNMDIAPTIMDYCTGQVPSDMIGKSWRELIEPSAKKPKPLRDEFFFDFWHNQPDILPPMQAVRTERYKLIKYEYQPYEELYDLVKDPIEKYNRINDVQFRSVKNSLEKRLKQWKKRTGWVNRSSLKLSSIYISKLLTPEEDGQKQIDLTNPEIAEIVENKRIWNKLEREDDYFDLTGHIPKENEKRIFYVAIPLNNRGEFDPFISLRFSFPESNQESSVAYTSYFEGKEIYMNFEYKKMMNIPPIINEEETLRKGFDLGYNPPLKPGRNVIILRMVVNNKTSHKWNVFVVGGLTNIKWL
ncbi:MAG: sulfatase-like hydrolase/transferase [Bacteroidota bacterium]|nr:sulfatase-like hydrolase/transferase [Bacteroidota bacterium]